MDTYVVRVWRPAAGMPDQDGQLCGTVHDLKGQSQEAFSGLAELEALLSRRPNRRPAGPAGNSQVDPR